MKTLVVFYSRTGTTKKVGEGIANRLNCDSEEIIDLRNRKGIFGYIFAGRDAIKKKLTDIQEISKDVSKYELVIIGTPNWGGSICPAVRTFLEKNKINIKKAGFFCTMGGDNPGKIFIQMEEIINKKPIGTLALRSKEVHENNYYDKINQFVNVLR